jgi:hypothetical protein
MSEPAQCSNYHPDFQECSVTSTGHHLNNYHATSITFREMFSQLMLYHSMKGIKEISALINGIRARSSGLYYVSAKQNDT